MGQRVDGEGGQAMNTTLICGHQISMSKASSFMLFLDNHALYLLLPQHRMEETLWPLPYL